MTPAERFFAASWAADLPAYLQGYDADGLRDLLNYCEEKGETGRIWTATALEILRRFAACAL